MVCLLCRGQAQREYAGAFLSGAQNLRSTFGCAGPHLSAILLGPNNERTLSTGNSFPSIVSRLRTCQGVNNISRAPSSRRPGRGPSFTPLEKSALENHCEVGIQCEAFSILPETTPLSAALVVHCGTGLTTLARPVSGCRQQVILPAVDVINSTHNEVDIMYSSAVWVPILHLITSVANGASILSVEGEVHS